MKIAIILPSLAKKGPVIVAKEIVSELLQKDLYVEVFYFSNIVEVNFECKTKKVSFLNFSIVENFDVIHSHGIRPDLYVSLNSFVKDKLKISTAHNIVYQEYLSNYNHFIAKVVEKLWNLAWRKHDVLICLTSIMESYYSKLLSKEIIIINNGRGLLKEEVIDNEDLKLICQLKERYSIIGTACVVNKRKGLHQVLELLVEDENLCFLLIGDGSELNNLKVLADNYGINERFISLGYRDNATSYFYLFDYYIISSFSEGLPLSLLEAAQKGIPSLCSDINIHKELFTDKEVVFFKLNNKISIQDAFIRLKDRENIFRKNILHAFEKKYTRSIMGERYIKVYNRNLKE